MEQQISIISKPNMYTIKENNINIYDLLKTKFLSFEKENKDFNCCEIPNINYLNKKNLRGFENFEKYKNLLSNNLASNDQVSNNLASNDQVSNNLASNDQVSNLKKENFICLNYYSTA